MRYKFRKEVTCLSFSGNSEKIPKGTHEVIEDRTSVIRVKLEQGGTLLLDRNSFQPLKGKRTLLQLVETETTDSG